MYIPCKVVHMTFFCTYISQNKQRDVPLSPDSEEYRTAIINQVTKHGGPPAARLHYSDITICDGQCNLLRERERQLGPLACAAISTFNSILCCEFSGSVIRVSDCSIQMVPMFKSQLDSLQSHFSLSKVTSYLYLIPGLVWQAVCM